MRTTIGRRSFWARRGVVGLTWAGSVVVALAVAAIGWHVLKPSKAAPAANPLIWGTNLAMDSSSDQFLSNSGAAPALQGLHAQLVRMPIRSQLTTSDYTNALNKIKQIGATPLLIVHGANYSSDPYPPDSALLQLAKSIFPTQTVYVDFGNEEDLAGTSVSTYVSGTYGWNKEIPRFKQITGSNFKYGGPVNFQYNESYIKTFVSTANPLPDYIVWHMYAGSCGHNTGTGTPDSQSKLLSSVDNWAAHLQQMGGDMTSIGHKGMPIIIDEWNYASDLGVSGSNSPCWSNDQAFINQFFTKTFSTWVNAQQYGLIGAAEYEAFMGKDESMIVSGNSVTYQGAIFKSQYEAYSPTAPSPTPSPSPSPSPTPTPTPSPSPSPSPSPTPTPSPSPTPTPSPSGSGGSTSGTVDLGSTTSSNGATTYIVDGKQSSSTLNTDTLPDGQHTVVAQTTQPNGQVVTKEQTLTVNNHKSILDNAILRYGKPTVVSAVLVAGSATAGLIGYIVHRIRKRSTGQTDGAGPLLINPTGGPVNLPPTPFL